MQLEYCRGFHYIFLVIPSTPYNAVWKNFGKQTNTNTLEKMQVDQDKNVIRCYKILFFFCCFVTIHIITQFIILRHMVGNTLVSECKSCDYYVPAICHRRLSHVARLFYLKKRNHRRIEKIIISIHFRY